MFGRLQEDGVATIVARENIGMRTTGGISGTYKYIADVQPDGGGPAFRATFKEHFSGQFRNAGIRRPAVGETARVKLEARSQKVKFDRAALRAERNSAKKNERASFDATASAPPGSSPGASGTDQDDEEPT